MITWIKGHRTLAAAAVVVVVVAVTVGVAVVLAGHREPGPGSAAGTTTTVTTTTTAPTTTPVTTTDRPSTTTSSPDRTTTPPTTPPTTTRPPTTTSPAPPFPPGLRGQDLTVIPTSSAVVALTFDAGANAAGLPKILRALADARAPATFFLTGTWARNNPADVARIVAAGHRVANHSMTHQPMTGLTGARITAEVLDAQRVIQAAGADPRPLFRFPFGDRDARTIRAVNDLGYLPVRWTVDTLGWKGTSGGITAAQVTDRTLGALRPGEIVLMHVGANPDDGSTLDADALPAVLTGLRAAGYRPVTLDVLLDRT